MPGQSRIIVSGQLVAKGSSVDLYHTGVAHVSYILYPKSSLNTWQFSGAAISDFEMSQQIGIAESAIVVAHGKGVHILTVEDAEKACR